MSCHRRHLPRCLYRLPRCRAVPAFGLDAAGSAPIIVPDPRRRPRPRRANPIVDPAFGLNVTGSAPVIVPNPHCRPRPRLPRCRAIGATSLSAFAASLDAAPLRQPRC
jgi:hypothetical protein